jgi:hypothetical protein
MTKDFSSLLTGWDNPVRFVKRTLAALLVASIISRNEFGQHGVLQLAHSCMSARATACSVLAKNLLLALLAKHMF